jgi:hypothetical protein
MIDIDKLISECEEDMEGLGVSNEHVKKLITVILEQREQNAALNDQIRSLEAEISYFY